MPTGPSSFETVDAVDAMGYRFGDLLALARRSWVRRLAAHAAPAGFSDFRPTDTVLLRILAREAQSIGRIGDGLGISRQAARKLADGLAARGYATLEADPADARRRLVRMTDRGLAYHRALTDATELLNDEVRRVVPSDLLAADAVLRAVLTDEDRRLADAAVPRPLSIHGNPS
jgi:DNA-binding MarR family transcriptional regulator